MRKHLKPVFYSRLVVKLAAFYPTQLTVRQVLINSEIPEGAINLQGSAVNMWDSVIGYVESWEMLTVLLFNSLSKYENDQEVFELLDAVKTGWAFLPELDEWQFLPGKVSKDTVKIAIINSAEDILDCSGLVKQLKVLQLEGLVEVNQVIVDFEPGSDEVGSYQKHIADSCIVLLMLSPAFFSAEDCLKQCFFAYKVKKLVVPILLKECLYGRVRFLKNIIPLPKDRTFIQSSPNKNKVEMEICQELALLSEKFIREGLCL
ncbi:hypothetical protein BCL90_0974 [Pedobacter alluvionis]|nr:hypothetical protein BCL90_0974 [Pedobacter alluvionis]